MQFSQELIFHAEQLLAPKDYNVLISNDFDQCDPTIINPADPHPGETDAEYIERLTPKCLYNFPAVRLTGKPCRIRHISASITQNYTLLGKAITPIATLRFCTENTGSLLFFKNIPENYLTDTEFSFNGNSILTHDVLESEKYNSVADNKRIQNLVKFKRDLDNKFPYLPKKLNGFPTIFDSMSNFYSCSFQDNVSLNPDIYLPHQAKHLIIFPYASIPIPYSTRRISKGTVSIRIILNVVLEDDYA